MATLQDIANREEMNRINQALAKMLKVLDLVEMDVEEEEALWLASKILNGSYKLAGESLRIVYKMNPARKGFIERHMTLRGPKENKFPVVLTHTQDVGFGSELSSDIFDKMNRNDGIVLIEL